MEIESFNRFLNEIYYPVLDIDNIDPQSVNSDVITEFNDKKMIFNKYDNPNDYKDYLWEVIDEIKKSIVQTIIKSKSRSTVLFYLKQLKSELSDIKKSFIILKESNIDDLNEALKPFMKTNSIKDKSKQIKKFLYNKHLQIPIEFIKINIQQNNLKMIIFIHNFVIYQKSAYIEIKQNIKLFEDFIENLSSAEFKNKDSLYELNFIKYNITEDQVLKKPLQRNVKAISTLDIRQVALMYDYFEKANLFITYRFKKDKAFVANLMTGFSEKNLIYDGFSDIEAVKRDSGEYVVYPGKEKPKLYNLNSVKNALKEVLKMVDKDIKTLSAPPKKNKTI